MVSNSGYKDKTGQEKSQVGESSVTVYSCGVPQDAEGKRQFDCRIFKKYFGAGSGDYGGELCKGCNWLRADKSLYLSKSVKSQEFLLHRKARFIVRALSGVACGMAKSMRFRWFVLTESDEAIADRMEFDHEFNKFVVWLRYWCPDFQYMVVEHCPKGVRRDRHVISYGSDKLPVAKMRAWWLAHYKSTITGMAEIRNIRNAIYYLCGYLSQDEKYVRSWCSSGWVYRGWIKDSKLYKSVNGRYPRESDLVELALQSKSERDIEWFINTGDVRNDYR